MLELDDIRLFTELTPEGRARLQAAAVLRRIDAGEVLLRRGEAGRALFSSSRLRKRTSNDTDRLHKYLARYGLDRDGVVGGASG